MTEGFDLEAKLQLPMPVLARAGVIWGQLAQESIESAKRKSPTIGDVAIPMGLVEVKVCALDETGQLAS